MLQVAWSSTASAIDARKFRVLGPECRRSAHGFGAVLKDGSQVGRT